VDAGTFAPYGQLVASITLKVKKQVSTRRRAEKEATAVSSTVKDVTSAHVIAVGKVPRTRTWPR
jgi:hypothetical protein